VSCKYSLLSAITGPFVRLEHFIKKTPPSLPNAFPVSELVAAQIHFSRSMLLLFSAVLRGKLNGGKERREMDVRGLGG
jgi:hypothetical protein